MLWETSTTVIPVFSLSAAISPRISSLPLGSSPAVGSSRISTSGSMARTPAMATLLFCPPDRSKGDWL